MAHRQAPDVTGRRISAPSFIKPGTVPENIEFLSHAFPLVRDVCVVLFESSGSLAYTEYDLPRALPGSYGETGVATCHVHLPIDLDWARGSGGIPRAWPVIRDLARMLDHLDPWTFVLHPPTATQAAEGEALALLLDIAARWQAEGRNPADLLLENIEDVGPDWLARAVEDTGMSACLDIGHALAYGQTDLVRDTRFMDRVRLLHVYAPGPGPGHRHEGLDQLDDAGWDFFGRALDAAPQAAAILLEVFSEARLRASLAALSPQPQTQEAKP